MIESVARLDINYRRVYAHLDYLNLYVQASVMMLEYACRIDIDVVRIVGETK